MPRNGSMARQFLRASLCLSLLCGAAAAQSSAALRFTQAPTLTANLNPRAPLAAVLRFALNQPATTIIRVSDGKHAWELQYDAARNPAEGLPVVGMRPNRRHEIRVTVRDARGKIIHAPQPLEFTTPPWPAERGAFPPIKVTVNQAGQTEPGVTMMSLRREQGQGNNPFSTRFGMLAAVDAAGEVVWYYKSDARISDFERRPNGNILLVTLDYNLTEIDLLGNEVASWYAKGRPRGEGGTTPVDALTFHHEVDELANGNIAILSTERRTLENYYTSELDAAAPRKTQQVMGDVIVEFARDGKVVWRWNAFEHLDPYFIGYETFSGYWVRRGFPDTLDWSHANNLLYDPRDDSLLVSLRYLDAVLKIDRKTGDIRWILGDPKGWPAKLQSKLLKPQGRLSWFYHQHSPCPTPQGTLLIFDNSNFHAKPFATPMPPGQTFSRAVEYAIDEKQMTVREVWSSEQVAKDSVVAVAMGDVEWLPRRKNVLATYGGAIERARLGNLSWEEMLAAKLPQLARVREFTHTSPARVVWELTIKDEAQENPISWQIFCSDRWPTLHRDNDGSARP